MSTAVVSFGSGVGTLLDQAGAQLFLAREQAKRASPPCPARGRARPRFGRSPQTGCISSATDRPKLAQIANRRDARATRLKKINGTTSILIALMKKSPIHLMLSASGPQAQPVRTPRMSAVITRCHSGISNQVFSKSQPLVVRSSSSNHCMQRMPRGNSCRNCRGLHSFVTRCPLSRRARRARCACRSG